MRRRGDNDGDVSDVSSSAAVAATITANHADILATTSDESRLREKQFLLSCERGDIGSVRKLLDQRHCERFNINCVDPLGRSALLMAIENENIEMIELLLDHNIETGDAILYAIGEENVEAVEIIVAHLEKIDKFDFERQGVEITEHSAFTPDITPIVLAAHKDNYECIKLFLDKKGNVPHPHDVRCSCNECHVAREDDSLRLSRSRINAYRALTSPSLICLSARDPILYAFELSWELRRLSYIENEFRSEYQELSQKCQKFCVHMLDQVRGSKELEIVLNYTNNAWSNEQLARLKLAIQLGQKRFVAHPNCQQLLLDMWYDGVECIRNTNAFYKYIFYMGTMISFPILALIYLLAPTSQLGKFVKKPIIKFLAHSGSYVSFLILLIMAGQPVSLVDQYFGTSRTGLRKVVRAPAPTIIECAICAWVLGLIWVEIKQLWDCGLHNYCHNLWNILDFITNALYLCTGALRIVAHIRLQQESTNPKYREYTKLGRSDWDGWEPTLVSECVFATANIFSSLKLVHIFTVNPYLGPLKISLGRMVMDIVKFFLVYALVLFAFACGLNQLLWYYSEIRMKECTAYKAWKKENAWPPTPRHIAAMKESCDVKYRATSSIYFTAETLFWALFGLVDLSTFRLQEDHKLSEWTGMTIFGSYCCCSIIVLLNMLIAMMSNSYQYISNQADVEWKFARSKLFLEYFDDTATLPPPFNIVPSPKTIYYGVQWLMERYCCNCTKVIHIGKQKSLRNQKILRVVNDRENNYRFVTRNLVKRYIAQMQRDKQQNEGVTEDDVNEIKQDISAFRYELLGILRNAGFQTGHTDMNQKTFSRNKKRAAMAERRLNKATTPVEMPVPRIFKTTPNDASISSAESRKKTKNFSFRAPRFNWNILKKRVSFTQRPRPRQGPRPSKSLSFDVAPSTRSESHLPSCSNRRAPLMTPECMSIDCRSVDEIL